MNTDNPRNRPHWSYSSLNQLLNICSLQWFFERVAKLEKPFTPLPLSFGSAFHRTLEWYNLCRKEGESPSADVTADLFSDLWSRQSQEDRHIKYPEGADSDTVDAQGRSLVAHYVENVDNEERVVSVNETFAVPVAESPKPLIGELDLVAEKDGRRYIVDQKTSARRWPKDQADKSMQATCYSYAFRRLYPGHAPLVVFDVIVKNKQPVFERHTTTRSPDDERRLDTLIGQADSIVTNETYYPHEQSFACRDCPFAEPCKAWHRKAARGYSFAA